MADQDLLAAILAAQSEEEGGGLAALGGYESGDAADMALINSMMKSPFYAGQASHSGVGQISEALLPIIAGLIAGKQAEKKAAADSFSSTVKLVTTLESMKAAAAKEARAVAKEERDVAEAGRKEKLFNQAQEALGAHLPQASGRLNVDKITYSPSGPTVTLADQARRGSTARLADSVAQLVAGQNDRPVVHEGVFYDPVRDIARPLPDKKTMLGALKTYDDIKVYEDMRNVFVKAVEKAGPGGVGLAGRLQNAVANAGSQVDGIIKNVRSQVVQTGFDKKVAESSTFKKLFGPVNTAAARYEALRSALVFQTATVVAGQTGRALSDGDRENVERIVGPEWNTSPELVLANLSAIDDILQPIKLTAIKRAVATPRAGMSFDERASAIATGLAEIGFPEAAVEQLTVDILKSEGAMPREAD